MSNRIAEQNSRALDQAIIDRQKIRQRQTLQRVFTENLSLSKNSMQKALAKGHPEPLATKSSFAPQKCATDRQLNSRNPKLEKKEEQTPDLKSKSNEQAKRSDLKTDNAVKRKESRSEERGSQESEAFFQQAVNFGFQQLEQSKEVQGQYVVLSKEVINELVARIYLSIDGQGGQELTIELKNGILNGAKIRVSTKGNRISLRFSINHPETRILLQNSKSDIAERLNEKNLSLQEFVVH